MELESVITAISTLGFPIVACIYLIWSGNKRDEREQKLAEKREEREVQQNDRFAELLTDHRLALNELSSLNRASLNNMDEVKNDLRCIKDTLIKVELRPCQQPK